MNYNLLFSFIWCSDCPKLVDGSPFEQASVSFWHLQCSLSSPFIWLMKCSRLILCFLFPCFSYHCKYIEMTLDMDSTLRGKREGGECREGVRFEELQQIAAPHLNFTTPWDRYYIILFFLILILKWMKLRSRKSDIFSLLHC